MDYQPLFDGETKFCDPSFHLVNKTNNSLKELTNQLTKSGLSQGFGSNKRKKRRSRNFGPLKVGPQLGLPLGVNGPDTIYQTFPDPLVQGSPLPRPYGPRDNLRMQSFFSIRGFGSNKRRKSKKSKKTKKPKKSKKSFGQTPGTQAWKNAAVPRNSFAQDASKYVKAGNLKLAQGLFDTSKVFRDGVELVVPPVDTIKIGAPYTNLPMQYSENQLNTPVLSKFGSRSKISKLRSKRKKSFGSVKLSNMAGPNTVGYQQPIPMYHAGGTTVNFLTNKLYSPEGIIPKVGKVQPDGMTPNAWLTRSSGLGFGSKSKNLKPKMGKRRKYGSNVYNVPTSGTGHLNIMQPDSSTYGKFGKKSKLKSSFGGKVITLNPSGKISITNN